MQAKSKKFLYKLLTTPSPSGYEEKIQKVVKSYVSEFADTVKIDLHGNLIAGINTKAKRRVMLSGHCDQIGFMVKHISDAGYIYVSPVGGIDFSVVPGALVTIHTSKGEVEGVFGGIPIHLKTAEQRRSLKVSADDNWIDIGAKDGKQANKLVNIGDPITYKLGVTELQNDLIASPGLDDKGGCFIAMETLRLCAKAKLSVALYAVSSIQEEVGLRGATTAAYGIDPEIGIGIDVLHATDNPGHTAKNPAPIKLSGGPAISRGLNTNPVVEKKLRQVAKDKKITVQTSLVNRPGGNDTSAIQVSRAGVATAGVTFPNRYMHTQVEVCSLKDIENSAKLLAEFVKSIKPSSNFTPK